MQRRVKPSNAMIGSLILIGVVLVGVLIGVITRLPAPQSPTPPTTPDGPQLQLNGRVGVWWWHDQLDDSYLDFAAANSVTEIYYCSSRFNDTTNAFIAAANQRQMQVYWLAGEYQWLENWPELDRQIAKYQQYQQNYAARFAGIHLDIEPHQHPDFKNGTRKNALCGLLVQLADHLATTYPDIWLEYDLPFWLDNADQYNVTYHDVTKPAAYHMIDIADRVTLMSYRDTAAKIYQVGADELAYAQSVHKPINFGVETYSREGDQVSFLEEGKAVMYAELQQLRQLLPADAGIVIHQIKRWYDLSD